MKSEEKEALIRTIADPGGGGTHGREAAKAKLEVALAGEVNHEVAQVSAVIEHAQTVLGERLSELTREITSTREAMNSSSREMAALTSALVRWTSVSVVVIAIYTVLTGVLVWIQFSRSSP